jgi:hypothetical protein
VTYELPGIGGKRQQMTDKKQISLNEVLARNIVKFELDDDGNDLKVITTVGGHEVDSCNVLDGQEEEAIKGVAYLFWKIKIIGDN